MLYRVRQCIALWILRQGEICGLIQLSAQFFCFSPTNKATIEQEEFNKYIQPTDGAIWFQLAVNVHDMNATSCIWRDISIQLRLYFDCIKWPDL